MLKNKKRTTAMLHLMQQQWAIIPEELASIISQATDNIEAFFDVGEAAIQPLTIAGDIGKINVNGVIFGRSNILTLLGMGTSIENIDAQYTAALADDKVKSIDFNFETPGGEFQPSMKFAEKLYANRGQKPTRGIIDNQCASAGYMLASALDTVEATDDSNLIGALGVIQSMKKGDDDEISFVSSNAPNKNADPNTDEGKSIHQTRVDKLGNFMMEKIARNRGVSASFATANFGKGDVLLAREAIDVNMIDNLSNYDGGTMKLTDLKAQNKDVYDEAVAEVTAPLQAQINTLTEANEALAAEALILVADAEAAKALIPASTEPTPADIKIEALEKEILTGKISGCVEAVQTDLMALFGKVPNETIVALSKQFVTLQAKIDAIGGSVGSDDDDSIALSAKIKEEAKNLVENGMSPTAAYTQATLKFTQ